MLALLVHHEQNDFVETDLKVLLALLYVVQYLLVDKLSKLLSGDTGSDFYMLAVERDLQMHGVLVQNHKLRVLLR